MLAFRAEVRVVAHSFDAERHSAASDPAPQADKAHAGEPLGLRCGVLDFCAAALLAHRAEHKARGACLLQLLQVVVVLLCLDELL